jgi:single-stranded-DNA-specific exonuclease
VRTSWIEPEPIEVPEALRRAVGGNPLVAELLARRGLVAPEAALAFLDARRYRPAPALSLPNMAAAIERLARAIQERQSVVVWGDFDVDGQTATAILMSTLSQLGARVTFYIPHRSEESHGLNRPALEELFAQGVDLLLTCDCGVSDTSELEFCRQRGVDVLVTDHHDLPAQGVPAPIVVDPKLLPADAPTYALSGAGVAYKVAQALLERFGRARLADDLLDLAALGTVADVVPLLAENRYIVQRGLPALAEGRRVGLRVLAEEIGLELSALDTETVTYELAPALNAAGRLASAQIGVHLLMTTDRAEAEELAAHIVSLNEERRYQTRLVERMALDLIDRMPRPLPAALVLAHPDWHPGVTGIVAGRLTELFNRPAVLISLPEGGIARGSARSVPGIDVHQAIVAQRDLLLAEGGHPMAAGFGLPPEAVEEFSRRLIQTVAALRREEPPEPATAIDAWVEWADVGLGLCEELGRLAPFGEGNRPPVLGARELTLIGLQALGERGEDWRIKLRDRQGFEGEVIWWRGDRALLPRGPMDIAFTLRANLFNGQQRAQATLVDVRRTPAALVEVAPGERAIEILDQRRDGDAATLLQGWLARAAAGEAVACWGEGRSARDLSGLRRREQIGPAETLVLWTVPPGPDELRAVLLRSGATRLALLYGDSPQPDLKQFVLDLLGLIKFTLERKGGEASVETLAGVLAQRRSAVIAGARLLHALHLCEFDLIGQENIVFGRCEGGTINAATLNGPASEELRRVLDETAAYRRYVARADATHTLPAGFVARAPA